ncbi:MAG: hypothetical protein V2I43_10770 [Parvularcula sp.]|jgi:hypothetical protein|nr:hypothetical protein [Parvularcula sp.]
MGSYLLARCFIRTSEAFFKAVKVLFFIVMLLLPFAVLEAITGQNALLDLCSILWETHPRVKKEPRWGLERVQSTFEHPILFGVFCGSVIGLVHMVLGYRKLVLCQAGRTGLVFVASSLSLSAGPLTGIVAQFELIIWNAIFLRFKLRWVFLTFIIASFLVVIEVFATRSAPAIFISYFSFNEFSAYMRIHIWNFGSASILKHPLFGIGFNEWERPPWMSASIDMFWIVPGVRYGIPAMVLMLLAFFSIYLPLSFRRGLYGFNHACRLGLVFSLTGLFLTGWTVHYWNATYVLFMFLLGSGVWLLDADAKDRFSSDELTLRKDLAKAWNVTSSFRGGKVTVRRTGQEATRRSEGGSDTSYTRSSAPAPFHRDLLSQTDTDLNRSGIASGETKAPPPWRSGGG